jgi:hypothetical protein
MESNAGRVRLLGAAAVTVLAVIVPLVLGILAWETARANRSREAVLDKLGGVSTSCDVEVAGQPVPRPEPIVAALRTLRHEPAHHSHPTNPFRVDIICSSDAIRLVLARDSERLQEYWVFEAHATDWSQPQPSTEIGRISTTIFADR